MKIDIEKIDIDLITLSYIYLLKKKRKSKIEYTTADLFDTCHDILKRVDLINSRGGGKKINFVNGYCEIKK